ncbi:unnamed protein product [Echinostoma caproni]|uniref:Gag-pol polyprotein n=1 Tax=Echinostoma caproni TaxID=27848 RepID=A0A183AYN5_9TREM|nr:unnamed protein product [Echinostoma caproni]
MPRVEWVPVKPCYLSVGAVGDMPLSVLSKQCVSVQIGGVTVTHEMFLIGGVSEIIIGVDLLRRVGAKIGFVGGKLLVGSQAHQELARKISTENHNVGPVDQRSSRYYRIKPVGTARGRRSKIRVKCGPKPTGMDQQNEA